MPVPVLLRAVPWSALLALTGVGAATGAGALALASPGTALVTLEAGTALLGGAAACALDEPAAAVVAACPVRRSRQLLVRALAAALPLLVGAALVLGWAARVSTDRVLLLEVVGCCVLGFALATLSRARYDEPAEVVVPPLVLLFLTALLSAPVGRHVPLFSSVAPGHRVVVTWWLVLGCCAVALLAVVRERPWHR